MRTTYRQAVVGLSLLAATLAAPIAAAAPFSSMVGDNDGYGFGVPDNGTAAWPGPGLFGSSYDGRSVAEAGATNGAQITDSYSTLHPGFGPHTFETANVIFPLAGMLNSATLQVDMGDFQAAFIGNDFVVSFNGVVQPSLFEFNDGFQTTVVRDFVLDASAIANANAAGQFVLGIDRNGSTDLNAFDYFQLAGDITPTAVIPEPSTYALMLAGLSFLGFAAHRRRKRQLAPYSTRF